MKIKNPSSPKNIRLYDIPVNEIVFPNKIVENSKNLRGTKIKKPCTKN